jgi:hypothetical protein
VALTFNVSEPIANRRKTDFEGRVASRKVLIMNIWYEYYESINDSNEPNFVLSAHLSLSTRMKMHLGTLSPVFKSVPNARDIRIDRNPALNPE